MLFEDKSLDIIKAAIRNERASAEYERESVNDMLIDFYEGRQFENRYLADYGFKDENGKTDLPMTTVNLTDKIIRKISLVYKNQPDRNIAGKDNSVVNEWFAFNEEFAIGYKYAERYKNLLSKVLHRAHFNPARKRWYPYIETLYEAHFLEDDPLHPYAFSFPHKQIVKSNVETTEDWWSFWSDDFMFFYIPGTDKIKYDEDFAGDGTNQFGIMPMVEMRSNFPIDSYESLGAFDLVRANQNVNIAMNNLNTMIYFQAHDQIVISGVQSGEVKKMKLGVADPIVASDVNVKFELLNFNPLITQSIEAIRFNIEAIGYAYNLKIGWSIEGNPASGFSLLVQNIDLAEAREDDVELMKMHEKKMYKVLSSMQEYYQRYKMLDKDEPKLPKDAILSVDFEESLRLPINQAEEIDRKQWELDNNLTTVVDLIQQDNPDMTEDEAIEKYKRNKKLNGSLTTAEQIRADFEQEGVVIEEEQDEEIR